MPLLVLQYAKFGYDFRFSITRRYNYYLVRKQGIKKDC